MEDQLDYHEIRYRLESTSVFHILRKDSTAVVPGFLRKFYPPKSVEACHDLTSYTEWASEDGS